MGCVTGEVVMTKRMKTLSSLLSVIVILLIARLALPTILHNYAEYRLNQIPDYQARIGHINVQLWRGSYAIHNIRLNKLNKNIPVPFFSANTVSLQLQWSALLHGKLAGQITIEHPSLNFVTDPQGKNEQLTIDQQWQEAVKALSPVNFNRIIINHGQIHYRSFTGDPPFNIYLNNVNVLMDNLQAVQKTAEKLSAGIKATGYGMDGSLVQLNVKLDPLAAQPTFKLNASIENMTIPAANDFLHHYTKLDIKQGYFSLYVEAAAAKGKITGYVKPMIKDLQVIDPKAKTNPLKTIYKGAVQVVANILENPEQHTVATKIPLKGKIDNPDTNIWSTIGNLLRHAFIQALLPQVDHTVKITDINLNQ